MLVVSANSSDPMNAFAALFEASEAHVCRAFTLRPFVDPHILRYYVLIHDISSSGPDLSESISLLENVKKTYGLYCCLLPINSGLEEQASPTISKLYSSALRHERHARKASRVNDGPPKVPAKDGQDKEAANMDESSVSINEEERIRWNTAVKEGVMYGQMLSELDISKIRSFVRDFSAQSLIPFLERCVTLWNEQLAASRKGLTGRLFGAASRKFFSGGSVRGSSQAQVAAVSFSTLGYYPYSSMESQTRRLADFAFMTRDYKLAAAMYDLGRRDYANDKAVKHVAGANEMFGLSHLMIMLCNHSPPIDVDSYLASAGQYYLISPRQKGSALQLDSLRATLLYYEAYRGLHYYRSAPSALVRTATEGGGDAENDLEVAGAMLLEQAAIADLRQVDRPALRKCALHLVMAAHRYRSCGQKHLSHRCFQGAASFYQILRRTRSNHALEEYHDEEGQQQDRQRLADYIAENETANVSQWDLIADHLEQELGQQASHEGQASQAVLHLFALLHRQRQNVFVSTEESSQIHKSCLQEFLNCCKYLDTDLKSLMKAHDMEASLPLIDGSKAMIQINTAARHNDEQWLALEAEAQTSADLKQPIVTQRVNKATVDEPFSIGLVLKNPLNTPLKITSLTAELQNEEFNTIQSDLASVDIIDEINLDPLAEKTISIAITVKKPCKVRCSSITYLLAGQVAFQESLVQKGKRLNVTKEQRASSKPMYAPNNNLTVIVENAKPKLEADLQTDIRRMGLGEEVEAVIVLKNKGKVPLRNVRVVVNRPDAILNLGTNVFDLTNGELQVDNDLKMSNTLTIPNMVDNVLDAGSSVDWHVLLRGSALGHLTLRLLFIYESDEGEVLLSQLQYVIHVQAVIDLAVQAGPSQGEDFQYHLGIDSINLSDPEEEETVSVFALSFVSPMWKTVTLGGDHKDPLASFTNMLHMERQTTSVILEIDSSSKASNDLDFTVCQLQNVLTGKGLDKNLSPPQMKLKVSRIGAKAQISPFLLLARKEFRLSMLAQQFPSIQSAKELSRIFTLYEPNEMDVIAHWESSKSQRRGQAFVFGLNLGPLHDYFENLFIKSQDKYTRSLYAEAEKEKAALWMDVTNSRLHIEEDPILFDFILPITTLPAHPQQQQHILRHNFTTTTSSSTKDATNRCTFPVEFLIRNLSTKRSRDVVIQLDNTLPSQMPQVQSAIQASYINRLTFRVTLAPQALTKFQAKASVNKAGKVFLAPILVRSTLAPLESGGGPPERLFQRWEHCNTFIKVIQSDQ